MNNCIASWSGGKDSAYALYLATATGARPQALLNMMNENGKISRSHGLPMSVLKAQAAAMNLPLYAVPTSWADYEQHFIASLQTIANTHPVDQVIFGDIDLNDHRVWEEKVCAAANLKAVLPLWKKERKPLVLDMLSAGFEAYIVSCQLSMGTSYLGRLLNEELVTELEQQQIDPCGENGEFHTVVTNCPLFNSPIALNIQDRVTHEQYCFLQLA